MVSAVFSGIRRNEYGRGEKHSHGTQIFGQLESFVTPTAIEQACVRARRYERSRFRVYKRDTCPAFTPLMYVLGSDRSLSHELLIVRHHNSLRVPHPSSTFLLSLLPSFPLARATQPGTRTPIATADTPFPHSSELYTPALETRVLFPRQCASVHWSNASKSCTGYTV